MEFDSISLVSLLAAKAKSNLTLFLPIISMDLVICVHFKHFFVLYTLGADKRCRFTASLNTKR